MRQILAMDPPLRPVCHDVGLFLDQESRPADAEHLSFGQKLNLEAQKQAWQLIQAVKPDAKFAILDVARNVCLDVDSQLSIDHLHTFRCNNHFLWVLPCTSLQHILGESGRRLTVEEKSRMAGFTTGALRSLREPAAEKALGNTIPVPLIGDFLANVLAVWVMAEDLLDY